jgi:hypothetical protein
LTDEITGLAKNKNIRVFNVRYSMADIKQAIGFKAAVMTVDDEGLANSIINKLNENKSGEERDL